jgi:hypothetical protein
VAIMVSVFVVVFVTALNDYQKEKQFKALQAKQVCVTFLSFDRINVSKGKPDHC